MDEPQNVVELVSQGLAAYERQLGDGGAGKFSHGDQPSLADVCLVPQVFNARRYEVDLAACPRLSAIVDNCMALAAFQAAEPSRQSEAARAPG